MVDTALADLAERGIAVRPPANPLGDDEWRELLQRVYAPPIAHLA